VKTSRNPIRTRLALALAAAAAVAVAVVAIGQAGAASAPSGSQTIKSGAGPGWPKTLQPSDFVGRVDNPFFPLKPGSTWRYRGRDDHGRFADRMHVRHKTKTILGVKTTTVHDVVLRDGKQREVTNDWYAQDRQRNVWYFGENTKELDRHGHVKTREGSFQAGKDGAKVGVLFPGHPKVGQTARQEFFKGHAEDHFKVLDVDARARTPRGITHHAVRTKEWTPLEPDILDNKYYARGFGTVVEKTIKGGLERLHLVRFHRG
jgi:hypothetical protein